MKRSCRVATLEYGLLGLTLLLLLTVARQETAEAKMSVFDSPHNLSASGGRGGSSGAPGVSFTGELGVCIFCHVPHNATAGTPLWSRGLAPETQEYKPYRSSTLNSSPQPDKPTGASRLCLSCHDGTIALGSYRRSTLSDASKMPSGINPRTNPNLTTDLSDDHPISFAYTETLAQKSQLVSPSALPGNVRLEQGGVLECTACHDPHDNQYGNFLVMNNSDSSKPGYLAGTPLCVACHNPTGWSESSHNPTQSLTLANGCLNCHAVHNASHPVRLLQQAKEADNCYLSCHNGVDPASANVKALFGPSMYRHPVDSVNGEGIHDEAETLPAQNYHVQCSDCHNPHQVNHTDSPLAVAPRIDGALKGVRKDSLGSVATMEYEVCFKCHAGGNASKFSGITESIPNRMIPDSDQGERFDPLNPSFHPVMADRRSTGASLLVDYQRTMTRIYCEDCHNSNQSTKAGGVGANGPHGSQYEHILVSQYDMPIFGTPRNPYNLSQYALCFRCHDEGYIMNTGTAFASLGTNEHTAHVRDRLIPCFACHDPHGTPWKMQATATNNSHLINFDRNYASGALVANPVYTTTGPGSGSCTVNCHAVSGNTESYGSGAAKVLRSLPRKVPGLIR